MGKRLIWIVSAFAIAACGNSEFSSTSDDGGEVGPGNGDGGTDAGVEAGPGTPAHAPAAIMFVDQDPNPMKVQGTVTIAKATDESDVTSYALYWSSDGTTKLGAAITSIAKSGGDLTYAFAADSTAPANANSLLAFTSNDHGENPTSASSPGDNYARFNATTALTSFPTFSGTFVPIFYETGAKKSGLISPSDTFLCPASGDACTQTPTTLSTTGAPVMLASVSDSASGKIIGFSASSSGASLAICNADGSSCQSTALDASLANTSSAAMIIDDAGGKLYVVARASTSSVTVCNHDGTACAVHQVAASGEASGNYGYFSLAIDALNSHLVIGARSYSDSNEPVVIVCPLAFTSDDCVAKIVDPTATSSSGYEPSVVVDKLAAKILVVTDYAAGSVFTSSLFRCDLPGDNCTRTDLSAAAGLGMNSGRNPSLAIEPTGAHFFVGVYNSDTNVPSLLRCNTDGTGCTATQITTTAIGNGGPMSLQLDPASDKIFFAYPTSGAPAFGSISVW
jgi:hypothetical protein